MSKEIIDVPNDDGKCSMDGCDNDAKGYVNMKAVFGLDDKDSDINVSVPFCEEHLKELK